MAKADADVDDDDGVDNDDGDDDRLYNDRLFYDIEGQHKIQTLCSLQQFHEKKKLTPSIFHQSFFRVKGFFQTDNDFVQLNTV